MLFYDHFPFSFKTTTTTTATKYEQESFIDHTSLASSFPFGRRPKTAQLKYLFQIFIEFFLVLPSCFFFLVCLLFVDETDDPILTLVWLFFFLSRSLPVSKAIPISSRPTSCPSSKRSSVSRVAFHWRCIDRNANVETNRSDAVKPTKKNIQIDNKPNAPSKTQ